MSDPFDFVGGILLGTLVGSLGMLSYHLRQIRQEARQNYVRLSLAEAEVLTLKWTLEIHRSNPVDDFTEPMQNLTGPKSEAPNALPPGLERIRGPHLDSGGTTSHQVGTQPRNLRVLDSLPHANDGSDT